MRCGVRSGERRLAGEQLVRHRAERVDVGAMIDVGIARGLLGRHVRRRADRRADLRERRAVRRPVRAALIAFAMPKSVTTARAAGEQHVVRLDVAVHDAVLVRVGERARHVAQDADRFGDRQRPAAPAARAATRPRRTASCSTAARPCRRPRARGTMFACCSARGRADLALERAHR